MPADELSRKYDRLLEILRVAGPSAVAFSGGVDSTFLAAAAAEAVRPVRPVVLMTVVTPYVPRLEVGEARELSDHLGLPHVLVELPIPEGVRLNPPDRCYVCKRTLFSRLLDEARARGLVALLEGTNADDLSDDRPGLRAIRELGVRSPLAEAGLTKEEIRTLSRRLGLRTWDKPAYACLLSRLPCGEEAHPGRLRRIELAERYLMTQGFRAVRVRDHGELARIEVDPDARARLTAGSTAARIAAELKRLGYGYVCLDLEGYRSGSMNAQSARSGERKP